MTVTSTGLPAASPPAVPQAGGAATPTGAALPAVTPTSAPTAVPTSPGSPVWEIPAPLTGRSSVVPPAGGQPPTAPIAIPGYLPLPPLVAHTHERCGDDGTAGCWSLAPWRSRTSGHSAPLSGGGQASGTATPRWAFAPPSVKPGGPSPSGVPGAFGVPYAGFALAADGTDVGRAGCWAFSPSAHCARWD
ncbi:hypothetical protein [Microbispora hainanensis]|uniref:Uncharacterized protein n=1 Tax=Microbispora hainanensis TaxID=568844 RepID=A0ABZ1SLD4_9ACTN|nr:hypothetical protein [Microbispora hainanensis]